MTNGEVLRTAMRQSAIDSSCSPEDFTRPENVVVRSCAAPGARRYLALPFFCDLVSYGGNVVASVSPEIEAQVRAYINARTPEQCFETPDIYRLNEVLAAHGMRVRHMAEYFLPDVTALRALPCRYETRFLSPAELAPYYTPQWANALCEKRRELDVLAMGAFDGQALVGLAGCSADCGTMWQIGVDVLAQYRRQGIASALTSGLAAEVLRRGIVPFYCCAWANMRPARNALKSGFRPAWAQLTAKSALQEEKPL